MLDELPGEAAAKQAKFTASFSGPIRANLCWMLDGIGLLQQFRVPSSSHLFESHRELLHTTFVLRYPVFVAGENYTGHTPNLLRHPTLSAIVDAVLAPELASVRDALSISYSSQTCRTFMAVGAAAVQRMISSTSYR